MLLRRALAGLVLFGLLVTAVSPAGAVDAPMMIGGLSVQPAVDLLMRRGIVTGDEHGNLRLGDTITRAELVKIIVAASGQSQAAAAAHSEPAAFQDVSAHWARGFIAVGKRMGLVSGYDDGTFRPNSPVSHAEAITMLVRGGGLRPQGAWPDAYLGAARSTGVLTEALSEALPPMERAVRASVFLLAERAFTRIEDETGRNLFERLPGQGKIAITASVSGALNGVTSATQVVISGSAEGALMVQANGKPAELRGGRFSVPVPLQLGRNEIYVLAADDLGNIAHQQIIVERR